MIRFTISDTEEVVSIDPHSVSSVRQIAKATGTKSLLSGNVQAKQQLAVITMNNGETFIVDDPNMTVVSQIESGKRV